MTFTRNCQNMTNAKFANSTYIFGWWKSTDSLFLYQGRNCVLEYFLAITATRCLHNISEKNSFTNLNTGNVEL